MNANIASVFTQRKPKTRMAKKLLGSDRRGPAPKSENCYLSLQQCRDLRVCKILLSLSSAVPSPSPLYNTAISQFSSAVPFASAFDLPAAMAQMRTPKTAVTNTSAHENSTCSYVAADHHFSSPPPRRRRSSPQPPPPPPCATRLPLLDLCVSFEKAHHG